MKQIVCEKCGASNTVPETEAGDGANDMACAECGETISAGESAPEAARFDHKAGASAGGIKAEKNGEPTGAAGKQSARQGRHMIGERSGDSLLFDANTPRSTAPKTEASVEDSGIVDVAKLLSAAKATAGENRADATDDSALLRAKPLAVGSLSLPSEEFEKEEQGGKIIYAILGAGLFIGAAILGAAWILKPQMQPIAGLEQNPGAGLAQTAAAAVDENQTEELDPEQEPAVGRRGESGEQRDEAERPRRRKTARASSDDKEGARRERSRSKAEPGSELEAAEQTAAPTEPAPESAKATEKASSAKKPLESLLDNAVVAVAPTGAAAAEPAAGVKPARDLPEKPPREQVLDCLRRVQSKVSACAGGKKGTAMVAIKVSGSGKVKSVKVSNVEEPAASCIADAVKQAKFPEFSDEEFSINFPFRL